MKSRDLLLQLLILISFLSVLMSRALADQSKGDCTASGPGEKTCNIANRHLIHGGNGAKVVAVMTDLRIGVVEEYWENKTKWIFRYNISNPTDNFDARLQIDFLDKDGNILINSAISIPIDLSCPRENVTNRALTPRQGVIDYDYAPQIRSIRLHDDRVIIFDGPC